VWLCSLRCFRRQKRRRNVCSNQEEGNNGDAAKELDEGKKKEEENGMNNDKIECVVKSTEEESETMLIPEAQITEVPQNEESKDRKSNDWHAIVIEENFSDEERGVIMEDHNDHTMQLDETVIHAIQLEDNITPDCSNDVTEPIQENNEIEGTKSSEGDPNIELVLNEPAGIIGDIDEEDHTVTREMEGETEPYGEVFGDKRDSHGIWDTEKQIDNNDNTIQIENHDDMMQMRNKDDIMQAEAIQLEDIITPDCSNDETEPTRETKEIERIETLQQDLKIEHLLNESAGIIGDKEHVDHTVTGVGESELFGDKRHSLVIGGKEQQKEKKDVIKQKKLQFHEKTTVVTFDSEEEPKEVKNAVKDVGELNEEPREKKRVKVNVAGRKHFRKSRRPIEQSEADQGSGITGNGATCSPVPGMLKLLVRQKTVQKEDFCGFEQREYTPSNSARKEMKETSVKDVRLGERGWRPERKTRSGWTLIKNHLQQNGSEIKRGRR